MKRAVFVLPLLLLIAGCESEAEKARKMAEERARADRVLFEQRKTEVLTAPGRFLETSDLAYFDKGIINDYRQLIGVKVTNRSAVPVKLGKGRIVWLTDKGEELGSSPLTFKGTLAPGAEMKFSTSDGSLTSGTIQGRASKAKIEFTEIEVIASAQL
ncbi:MAG: hypothetical protein ACJ8AT_05205 [Hyalangium sp.]|uniref:hypothetical protein n=1 Tax=Hyalangium sp. TaxID=2028555 RepID=UPI003899D246